MPSAFVSHSSPDDGYVAELDSFLRALGYTDVFNDSRTINPDDKFWPVIEAGILKHDVLIVVLTKASTASTWVAKEIEFADANAKRVIPVWIEDCTLPTRFADRDVIDFRPKTRPTLTAKKIAPSRILRHSPKILFGRDDELKALDDAWANPNLNVYTLVAWGGAGKTSLVAHWVQERLAAKGWPGVERYFDWSFYSQGTGESRQTSSDLFVQKALEFFGDPDPIKGSPWERGERLADLTRKHKTLLVLDGIEPLQYPPTDKAGMAGRLKDQALEALLQSLASDNPGLCVVTTREHLTNIEAAAATEEKKLDKLLKDAAVSLLRHLQVVGSDEEMHAAWEDAGGHALTLQLLGRFIADAYEDRDIRHYKQVKFEAADVERQGRSAFKVMIAYESWLAAGNPERQRELAILRLSGLFDRPMSRDCLAALRSEPAIAGLTDSLVKLNDREWNIALKRLNDIDLITAAPDSIDAHPLIREYFGKQLKDTQPAAFQAAHSRLFDHLCKTTPHRPDGIDGLAPLYQAVAHGCLAGRQQEACDKVYFDRILRGGGNDGFYSSKKLGAIGADLTAVAAFFDEPWGELSPNLSEADQSWLLNAAAYRLRALGRLTEAVAPMRAGLDIQNRASNWKHAAIAASNLSELELTLGKVGDSVNNGRRSVEYADLSGDAFQNMGRRITAADALHQSGQRAEAGTLFADAEWRQKERKSEYDILHSTGGFKYCEWLLVPVEREAWCVIGMQLSYGTDNFAALQDRQITCAAVEIRAKSTLGWAIQYLILLDIALDRLTLARIDIYRTMLIGPIPQATLDLSPIAEAINGLRKAGTVHHLPKGLLTAALYHFVRGEYDLAKKNLNEAEQIAERGPMPLYLADVHLHRARMFKDKGELAKAKELIVKHGYGRRNEELADAELAAKGW